MSGRVRVIKNNGLLHGLLFFKAFDLFDVHRFGKGITFYFACILKFEFSLSNTVISCTEALVVECRFVNLYTDIKTS
ncbi:hypothetical protein E5288_WYG010565 [Bos mutus]|uniref:Uncharacterized protein n=1 Tax=Bos mutus TaxID=72004 RepID=A0A6B0RNX1_9CETA|nr:hypothetical protein [Bos mutus]